MTNPMFNPNPQPNYSGVTIQIANPSVYAGGGNPLGVNGVNPGVNSGVNPGVNPYAGGINTPYPYGAGYAYPQGYYISSPYALPANNENSAVRGLIPADNANVRGIGQELMPAQPLQNGYGMKEQSANYVQPYAYPPQYYLNNYNYQAPLPQQTLQELEGQKSKPQDNIQDIKTAQEVPETKPAQENALQIQPAENEKSADNLNNVNKDLVSDNDMTKSNNIIDDLNQRAALAEEEKKNKQKDGIVPLTDEYIKSLENYLNNPNDEIRLMASKEILTRLDEDKDRYDDAALNALLNKMLQDPSKLIRIAALSAFSSQLASGNDYTVTLLHNIQQNPSADKEDVLQAADILLKMSAGKEITDIPDPSVKEVPEGNNA